MSSPPPETMDLIHRSCGGDRQATEALIGHYRDRVARFVIQETGEASQYEDLCQVIFVKVVLALPRLRARERFEPWLFQIARNACRDHLRARQGWRKMFVSWSPEHESVPAPEVSHQETGGIEHAIAQLPPEQQDLLRLHLEGSRSYAELAQVSHSSVSAVKSRLYRARENLRAFLLAGDV
jgi:RNA polymerase sigma-70 factor (ECF subfamily)